MVKLNHEQQYQSIALNDMPVSETAAERDHDYPATPPDPHDNVLSHRSSNKDLVHDRQYEDPPAKGMELPGPRSLQTRYLSVSGIFAGLLDAVMAILMLLFIIFGALVYTVDGQPSDPGSDKLQILQEVARYAPTIFPLVFAAIVSRSMRAFATWRLQKGTTIGLVEQLLGSSSISGALLTQISLQAFNFLGLGIILIWCLSPVGSQASLRVIYDDIQYLSSASLLTALNPYTSFNFGGSIGMPLDYTSAPFTAALISYKFLSTRTQDLWGNIRIPQLYPVESFNNSSWQSFLNVSNVTYSSLIGLPFSTIPTIGNTTFTISTSYLNLSCPIFEPAQNESSYTNYNSTTKNSDPPAPLGATDCSWDFNNSTGFLMAISSPCKTEIQATRDARTLVFESLSSNSTYQRRLHAECQLYTTYLDVNVSCVETTCSTIAARISPDPPINSNWTAFDIDHNGSALGASVFVKTFTNTFGASYLMVGQILTYVNPIVQYLSDPENAVFTGPTGSSLLDPVTPEYSQSKSVFETRLGQLLNSHYLIGIDPAIFTEGFGLTPTNLGLNATTTNSTTTTSIPIVRCNNVWLAVLIVSAFVGFLVGMTGCLFRLFTLVPDVLGTMSLAMLDNRCEGMSVGGSTISGGKKATILRDVSVRLGDVEPWAEVGNIALAGPVDESIVNEVRGGRLYK